LRTENKLVNVFKHKKLEDNVKLYKKGMIAMAVVVILVIITAILLVATGVATENPSVSL
jgi:hypothetical protein